MTNTTDNAAMRERYDTIHALVLRAEATGIFTHFDRLSMFMDIDYAADQFDLDLCKFLHADDGTFMHDFAGILANMNRTTGKVENCFLPRIANQ